MAIEHRFRRTYYYKKVRVNGKVRSIYLGAGKVAEDEALRQMKRQFYRNLWKAIDNLRQLIRNANRIQSRSLRIPPPQPKPVEKAPSTPRLRLGA